MSGFFTLKWGKPRAPAETVQPAHPLDATEVALLNSYADAILKTLQRTVPDSGYDRASIGRLSADLTANAAKYSGDQRMKNANRYGAFLGKAILATYREYPAAWVRWKGDVGLEFAAGTNGIRKILFPISRVFKHI
jgi:hypothetical protein